MKKLFTFLLAGIMVLSLTACGGEETTTANNDTGTAVTDTGSSTVSMQWPSDISSIKWNGSGKVVGITEVTASKHGEVWIYIDVATLNEVSAYIDTMGFKYNGEGEEPALAFDDGEYYWEGRDGSVRITLFEEPTTTAAVDGTYQLRIEILSATFS